MRMISINTGVDGIFYPPLPLKSHIISEYMRLAFCYRYEQLILKKLCFVREEEFRECANIAYQIWEIFSKYYDNSSEIINHFVNQVRHNKYANLKQYLMNTFKEEL